MKKLTTLTIALASLGFASAVLAQDAQPNPSDLTETSTSAYFGLNNQGDLKGSISGDFHFDSGQTGMLTVEGTMDKEGKYSDSRMQYFHVFSTNNTTVPRAAVSIDLIDNAMFTSASVGGVAAINAGVKGLQLFPRLGALVGEYSDESVAMFKVDESAAAGVSAAFYAMYTLGEDGTYIGAWPEYNYLNGDIETSLLKSTIMIATPFSSDKTRWGQLRVDNTSGKMQSETHSIDIDDTVVWANYKFYF
ncbi:hypothetical protein J4N42_22385 [Vibrio sp. SCSIO 43135]|uniref:hypothetical protein n=1 Tax=Vibrio sp. SCSIO 43135 TaxID=2819096 RepID=UPI0020751BF1|nr:hypothetical protein [Vibrio sp. SCSIO 43135]USD43335.1 hypothetical protein J4N42_22385 [Vibrio sp. SCSIO 43135]